MPTATTVSLLCACCDAYANIASRRRCRAAGCHSLLAVSAPLYCEPHRKSPSSNWNLNIGVNAPDRVGNGIVFTVRMSYCRWGFRLWYARALTSQVGPVGGRWGAQACVERKVPAHFLGAVVWVMHEVNASDATISACNHHCLSLWSPSHLCFCFIFSAMVALITCITCFYVLVVTERNRRRRDGTGKLNISIIHIALHINKW